MIDPERIMADIEAIAGFSEHEQGHGPNSSAVMGYSRPTFSEPWARAREYVIDQAGRAGCEHIIDAAGNVHIRSRELGWRRAAWLSGSHIDSVPSGGKYDGVMGVVIPLEILRARPDLPLELVVFAEEEGTTFNLGMLGSRAWTGALAVDELHTLTNRHGQSAAEAGERFGLSPQRLRHAAELDGSADPREAAEPRAPWTDRINPTRYLGMVEVHAEQGVGMWEAGVPIAAVDRINGRRQFEIVIEGQANHAGSTGMIGRRDALAGAAELVAHIERLGAELNEELPYSVMTVGRLAVAPGAVNVIPGRVRFSVDARAQEETLLDRAEEQLRRRVSESCARRGLTFDIERSEAIAPSPLSSEIGRALQTAGAELGLEVPIRPSGALHDAAIIAPHVPTAMIFVASKDGISHNPAEFSRTQDIARAAEVLLRTIEAHPQGVHADAPGTLTLAQLNTVAPDVAADHCAHFFENSPWITERALAHRPFDSLAAFHARCMRVIDEAGREAKTELIRAHPDLVGRMAQEGRLGAESTREQAAAGLTNLTPTEVAEFERLNAAYFKRFAFPFVICARQNKKEAILEAFPQRLEHDRETEIETAIDQIGRIAWLRMQDAIRE
jgi:OHCU decarboxylase